MKTLAEFVKNYRKENKVTQQELAEKSGLTKGFISQIENDYRGSKNNSRMMPSLKTLKSLANGMNIDFNDFLSEIDTDISLSEEQPIVKHSFPQVPHYHLICCGNGGFVDDQIIDYISLPPGKLNPNKDYFAQTASGDSMIGANIHNGDILIFEKTGHIENGQIGCFCIDDNEAMCKRYKVTADGHIILMPANDKYDPIPVDITMEHFRCIGVLVYCIVDMKGM